MVGLIMVRIEDVTVESLHRKLKRKKVEELIKEVFGKFIDITECANSLYVRERHIPKFLFYPMLGFGLVKSKSFLGIRLHYDKFDLSDEKYLDKTKELAEKYKMEFGNEVTIKTDYSEITKLLAK